LSSVIPFFPFLSAVNFDENFFVTLSLLHPIISSAAHFVESGMCEAFFGGPSHNEMVWGL